MFCNLMLQKGNKFLGEKLLLVVFIIGTHQPTLKIMNKRCPNCSLSNFSVAENCIRCGDSLQNIEVANTQKVKNKTLMATLIKRAAILALTLAIVLFGFYLSLIGTANRLAYDDTKTVETAIKIVEEKGFKKEAFFLKYIAVYRADDNWLNASVEKATAYAATNFPFEIITLYPEFFKFPIDDTERASILLHEAQHLLGSDEHDAYSFVWKNRDKLGYSEAKYQGSEIYNKVGEQTKEHVPELFVCPENEYGDCTR
jgi:hypothetical protein